MSALTFGHGWPDSRGRRRALIWVSDLGWVLFDSGWDVQVIRRGIYDEIGLRARLLGWEDHVDDPRGVDWVTDKLAYWAPTIPNPDCIVCQGEGWVATTDEGGPIPCVCGEAAEPF